MAINHYSEFKEDINGFIEDTKKFYKKELTVPEYKSISGGFGSYAQRGAQKSMLRLRLTGGEINYENISFINDSIKKYGIDLVHITTCQSIQLHNLSEKTVCKLVMEAYNHGIITRGGGGDFPRNVMCSPLTGVEIGEYFDVMPYAKQAADYLLGFIHRVKLPRKLKVCFCSNSKNETHATFRDLGFVATRDGKFDVYIAGGLGNKPKMGLCAVRGIEPEKTLYCIKTMIDIFTKYGNYESRAVSRTRFLQDTLGKEELVRIYQESLYENLNNEDLLLKENLYSDTKNAGEASKCCCSCDSDCNCDCNCVNEGNMGANNRYERVVRQKQNNLFAIEYHPMGGNIPIDFIEGLTMLMDKDRDIKIRLTPSQGMFIINLKENYLDSVLDITKESMESDFEKSTACIGASICQVGIGDSQRLLKECIERVRQENIDKYALPSIHISGCPSSCSAHQTATIGFRGGKKPTAEGPQFAFAMYIDGCETLKNERFGKDAGVLLAKDIPEFLVDLGKEVMNNNMTFQEYLNNYPEGIEKIAKKYV